MVKNGELAKGRPTEANRYLFVSIAKKYKIHLLAIEIGWSEVLERDCKVVVGHMPFKLE